MTSVLEELIKNMDYSHSRKGLILETVVGHDRQTVKIFDYRDTQLMYHLIRVRIAYPALPEVEFPRT